MPMWRKSSSSPSQQVRVPRVVNAQHTVSRTVPTHGSSSHSDSATPLAAAVTAGNHAALLDDYTSRQLPRDAHIITTPEKPINSSGLRGA